VTQVLPEIQALLTEAYAAEQPDPTMPLEQLRHVCDSGVMARHHLVRDHGPLHALRDLELAGVPVRLYVPTTDASLPVHVHLHGGGWWMGSIETVDPMARELAHVSGMAVVSVGYRLAPEHRFPSGLDDVYAVLTSLGSAELGFTPTTISVGGESAGANLAAAVCLLARDRGGPSVVAQWLDVPAVDLTAPEDDSIRDFGTGYGLEAAQLSQLLEWYCDADEVTSAYVSPALAPDLSGLPPAIVTTAAFDPIRDQGERFAQALHAAGNEVVLRRNPGQIHASSWFTALTEANAAWYDETVALLVERHRTMAAAR
jgi:acetyl esterase